VEIVVARIVRQSWQDDRLALGESF